LKKITFELGQLRQAGQTADRELLDRVKAFGREAVPRLIHLAVDEELNQAASDSPEVWAPLHAIQIPGELGAPDASDAPRRIGQRRACDIALVQGV